MSTEYVDENWLTKLRTPPHAITMQQLAWWGKGKLPGSRIGYAKDPCECPVANAVREIYNVPSDLIVRIGLEKPVWDDNKYYYTVEIRTTPYDENPMYKDYITDPLVETFIDRVDHHFNMDRVTADMLHNFVAL